MRLFRALVPHGVGPLFLAEIMLLSLSFLSLFWLSDSALRNSFFIEEGAAPIVIAVATIMFSMYMVNLYATPRVRSRLELLQQLCQAFGLSLIVQSVLSYARKDLILPKWFMLGGCLIGFVVIFAWRLAYSELVVRVMGNERLLFIGHNAAVRELAAFIDENPQCGYAAMGFIDDVPGAGAPWLGPLSQLREIVARSKPSRLIVGLAEGRNQMPVSDLFELRSLGYRIDDARLAVEDICARVSTRDLQPSGVVFQRELEPSSRDGFVRAGFDRAAAALCLVLFSPVLMLAALALAMGHGGRPFERVTRVGLRGRPFPSWRLKSGVAWIAALPELWSVVAGDMALVGPSAERPEFVRELSARLPFYEYRHRVRPGLVGWSQIQQCSSPNLLDTVARLEYDLYFIKHATLSMHLLVILSSLKPGKLFARP